MRPRLSLLLLRAGCALIALAERVRGPVAGIDRIRADIDAELAEMDAETRDILRWCASVRVVDGGAS